MNIENNILRHYLKNVYFITGTAYAGKSTMVKMLAERYGLVCCGENYHSRVSDAVASPEAQPDISWLNGLTDFRQFVLRTPEEYERWIFSVAREAAGFEAAELISLSKDAKVIADTNIPLDILREISDYSRVAVMLSPQSLSVDRFFDREDPEKRFLLDVINRCPDPEAAMENYKNGLRLINSQKHYDEFLSSGFFTVVRPDDGRDTREETCLKLARHFGFTAR
ncbi:MAG: hypothetical protein IKY06_06170 [Clostridia bacterium]|nr:hypothetical protein [Clostridia bacterium]MBR5010210.1 hypothetical protein [Clostridia bacterium]